MANLLRIVLIGTCFMGRVHAQAWRTAQRFLDLVDICTPGDAHAAVEASAHTDSTYVTTEGSPS